MKSCSVNWLCMCLVSIIWLAESLTQVHLVQVVSGYVHPSGSSLFWWYHICHAQFIELITKLNTS